MGFFKVLGYAAMGAGLAAGAVVAGPLVVGAVGVAAAKAGIATLAAAKVAGAAVATVAASKAAVAAAAAGGGAAIAATYASKMEADEVASVARREGREEGSLAQEVIDQQKLAEFKQKHAELMRDFLCEKKNREEQEKRLVALFAIGYAVAACDGEIADEERTEMGDFLVGVRGSNQLSDHAKNKLEQISVNPPTFAEAMSLLPTMPESDLELIDSIIAIVIAADHREDEKEREFRALWEKKRTELVG